MDRPRVRLPTPATVDRPRVREIPQGAAQEVGSYFTKPSDKIRFISTGCALLNCALGGGWPLGRVVNIIGDKSTGKTLLAIEAAANFYERYEGHVWYCESEAAFDDDYAEALGINIKKVLRPSKHVVTVEGFFEHLEACIENRKNLPGLYILDSLDALSDQAELDREFDAPSFGAAKAKKMSEAFRRIIRVIENSATCVMIISQIRDNITATFGRKFTRTGGRALDFYASQAVYLAQIGVIKKTIQKTERPIGLKVRAKIDKNKVGLPLRECEFPLRFGFGIDDVVANIEWLQSVGREDEIKFLKGRNIKLVLSQLDKMDRYDYNTLRSEAAQVVRSIWSEVETRFIPQHHKYGNESEARR